jgi:hypothetical protein
MSKRVVTIATGNKTYIDMACNLAMSFLMWNDNLTIKFVLVTDRVDYLPQRLRDNIDIVEINPGELGDGFSAKLQMDKFGCSGQNLFIDADCLVYGNLEPVFDHFKGHDVSVVGYNRTEGKDIGFCKDIRTVMSNTGINYFPLLCGSVYYFEKGELATKIFAHARSLLQSYEEIGLVPLRGKANEEPLMAISMAKFDQQPVNDTGQIKADRMFYEYLKTNVIKGKAHLWNNKDVPVPEYSELMQATPVIVHFNAAHAESFEYESEVIRLKKVFLEDHSITAANLLAFIRSVFPGKLSKILKDIFRPVYRAVFGYRKIQLSKRL